MSALSQNELDWLAARLSIAVYDVNRTTPEMSVYELKAAFRGVEGSEALTVSYAANGNQLINIGDKTLEVGPMASNDEIRFALMNPFIPTENTRLEIMPTIAEQLKAARAKLAEAREGATNAIAHSHDASQAVLGEVNKVLKEADDLRAEVAELTNGGPPLEDQK
jgi:hypothetical protein